MTTYEANPGVSPLSTIACAVALVAAGCGGGGRGPSTGSTARGSGVAATEMPGDSGSSGASGDSPCGQGTRCIAADDLTPPVSDGIQLELPDNSVTVQPSQELFLCYYRSLMNTQEVDVGGFQSWMTPGSSHHFIVYQVGQGPAGGTVQPDGTLQNCPVASGTWLYATSTSGAIVEMTMPEGVGLPFAANTQVIMNMHFINPSTAPVSPKVKLNVLYTKSIQYKAASMISFNRQINVPPAGPDGPGTQTVAGTCTAPAGSKFFLMSTHAHKWMTVADVNLVSGGATTNLVHSTDWEHPSVAVWNAPDFLTIQPGDSFNYSCSYSNSDSFAVTVGPTAATNEMCMAIGYYFPAGNTACQ